jgi:hypothetical protein
MMSDNILKNKKWVTIHSKNVSTIVQKGLSTTAQENVYKKITIDQVERIERR